jgi:nucleotide-binding universal stress UspA family protein
MISEHKDTVLFKIDFTDESKHALSFSVNFCKQADYSLILFNNIDIPLTDIKEEDKFEIEKLTADLIKGSDNKLKTIQDEIKNRLNFETSYTTYIGETTEAISEAVKNLNVKKIIMGAKTSNDLFLKNSSFIIVRNSLVPLLTINNEKEIKEIKTILFPFNENTTTLKKIDEVIKIAKLYQSKIHLLGISEGNTKEKINIITNQMMYIKSLFDEVKIESETHFYANANYSEAILEYCNFNTIDLITIANNHTNTIKANLSISNTKSVIKHALVPVLTIPVWADI